MRTLGFCGHMHFTVIQSTSGAYAVTDSGAVYSFHSGNLGNIPLYVKRLGVWSSYMNKAKTLRDYPNDRVTETELDTALEKAQQEKTECENRSK